MGREGCVRERSGWRCKARWRVRGRGSGAEGGGSREWRMFFLLWIERGNRVRCRLRSSDFTVGEVRVTLNGF
jgi:hypothetical protein